MLKAARNDHSLIFYIYVINGSLFFISSFSFCERKVKETECDVSTVTLDFATGNMVMTRVKNMLAGLRSVHTSPKLLVRKKHSKRMRTAHFSGSGRRVPNSSSFGRPPRRQTPLKGDPSVNRMTNMCKNITLPQTSFACGKNNTCPVN